MYFSIQKKLTNDDDDDDITIEENNTVLSYGLITISSCMFRHLYLNDSSYYVLQNCITIGKILSLWSQAVAFGFSTYFQGYGACLMTTTTGAPSICPLMTHITANPLRRFHIINKEEIGTCLHQIL